MHVGLKETLFESSSPFRHMCELDQIITNSATISSHPILFIYSDGGPDHRLTYISVQLSLICLFLKLDLDFLCACRTAPYHSWKNPVERVMSVLNLGLQSVGLARAELPENLEKEVAKCNTLSELRKIATRNNDFVAAVQDSLSPVKVLLSNIFSRLCLHEEGILMFNSATSSEISEFWSTLLIIDSTLKEETRYTKKNFHEYAGAIEFISHCCRSTHYSFDILKCGIASCRLCKPVRLPEDVFGKLHHLPHPMPGEDGHYIPFSEVFGKETSEEHRPSLNQRKTKKNTMSFYASVQHARNAALMVQCEECNMWRIIFSKRKLSKDQRSMLQLVLDSFSYTCGSRLSELNLSAQFADVEVKDHICYEPIERLYYSAKYDPICIYCGQDQPFTCDNLYPQCPDCIDKAPIRKK